MSDPDLLKTYKLTEYVVKNTNIIGRKKGNGYGTYKHIAEILNISEKSAREYLSRLVKMRVLSKITVEIGHSRLICYAFNPVYVNSCKYVPPILYNEFWEDMDEIIPEWMRYKYDQELSHRNIKSKKEAAKRAAESASTEETPR